MLYLYVKKVFICLSNLAHPEMYLTSTAIFHFHLFTAVLKTITKCSMILRGDCKDNFRTS